MNEASERILISQDWITITLLLVIALLLFNKLKHGERFRRLQSLLFNNVYINDYSKSIPLIFNVFNNVFSIIIILVISLLLFVVLNDYEPSYINYNVIYFFKIVFYVFTFILIRFVIGLLLGSIFEMEKEQQHFTFLKLSYLSNFCLIIIPLLVINFYIGLSVFSKLLILIAVLLILFYYFKLIKYNHKLIFSNLFYFILYLCALEIAPFVIIYRLLII